MTSFWSLSNVSFLKCDQHLPENQAVKFCLRGVESIPNLAISSTSEEGNINLNKKLFSVGGRTQNLVRHYRLMIKYLLNFRVMSALGPKTDSWYSNSDKLKEQWEIASKEDVIISREI